MLNWQYLAIGFVLGLVPTIFFVIGFKAHKNVEELGVMAPKLSQRFRGPTEMVTNTPERERELEQEEHWEGSTEDLVDESY